MNRAGRPTKLAKVVIPLILLPLILTRFGEYRAVFFTVLGTICFASVAGGFWWGEMRGDSEAERLGLGCASTLVLLVVYLILIFGLLSFPFIG